MSRERIHGSWCWNLCSGFGGKVCPEPSSCPHRQRVNRLWRKPVTNAEMVWEFHRITGLPARLTPTPRLTQEEGALRRELIREEFWEYRTAATSGDIVEIADALADLLYVVYGTAHAHGIPIDRVFEEVHRSNMSKLEDGVPLVRYDGKILKGRDYSPPDIKGVLDATQ